MSINGRDITKCVTIYQGDKSYRKRHYFFIDKVPGMV